MPPQLIGLPQGCDLAHDVHVNLILLLLIVVRPVSQELHAHNEQASTVPGFSFMSQMMQTYAGSAALPHPDITISNQGQASGGGSHLSF